uniref:Uncharacterized protein n=1 Tax=Tanacetum cinerariifolium TaxID=118510 RepID=A0A6L2KI41_TANCI|nr:hypothetical protein [Tanacetum cinerariifolium]
MLYSATYRSLGVLQSGIRARVVYHEPLSSDRVFDFLEDELERHPAYDFFAPAPLPGYAVNPNNNNEWLEVDDYLLGELEAMMDEQMVVPAIKEVAEPVAEAEEEQVIAPMVDMDEGQMDVLMIDMEEDLAELFCEDDDFENDSKGVDEEEVWEVNEEWLMAPITPPLVPAGQPPSVYEVEGPSTTRVNQVSDAKVAASVTIGELGRRIYTVEGQIDVQQRDTQIQQLQTTVTGMGSRENVSRPSKVGVLVEAEMVSPEVKSEKWRRPLLRWMYVTFDVSTDGREEDFFPRNGM